MALSFPKPLLLVFVVALPGRAQAQTRPNVPRTRAAATRGLVPATPQRRAAAGKEEALLRLLQGNWTLGPNENTLFTIRGKQMIYFDSSEPPVPFRLLGTTLAMHYGSGIIIKDQILKITPDSLVLKAADKTITRMGRMK